MGTRQVICCAALAACGGGGGTQASWSVVAKDQPSALLSVWGQAANDMWVVGGDPRDGSGPIVEHFDGSAWTKLDSGQRNVDLWAVHGFPDGTVYMSGTDGTILSYKNGTFTKMTTPGSLVVFGLWGQTSNDVWAVGGNRGGGAGGFAWRYDGTSWGSDAAVPADLVSMGTCWKVGGESASDVWISGTNGATLHWDGSALTRMDVPVEASLFSVAGNSERFITVGGAFDGVIYENAGTGWVSALPSGGPLLTGVNVSADDAYAVGQFGTILRRGADGTWAVDGDPVTQQNLHATFIDPSGDAWAVGGQFDATPMTAGVLVHKGETQGGMF